jgi:hypothetical protein
MPLQIRTGRTDHHYPVTLAGDESSFGILILALMSVDFHGHSSGEGMVSIQLGNVAPNPVTVPGRNG